MITTAKRLHLWERKRLLNRMKECEKRGGVSASLFLEAEMNALQSADCFFFYGTKRKCKGVLSVFFSSETQAEFTVAEFVPEKEVLPELFGAALAECRRCSVKEVYTVVNPLLGFSKLNECGVRLSYAFSEYFLCCDINTLTGNATESKERQEGEALKEAVLHRYEEADGAVRYCLAGQGQEAAECLVTPFDEGKMWYLFRLETKEEFRRQGFARRLLCETARELAAAGAEQIRLQVSSKNRPAETLYRQLGFWTEEQRDYYKTEEF